MRRLKNDGYSNSSLTYFVAVVLFVLLIELCQCRTALERRRSMESWHYKHYLNNTSLLWLSNTFEIASSDDYSSSSSSSDSNVNILVKSSLLTAMVTPTTTPKFDLQQLLPSYYFFDLDEKIHDVGNGIGGGGRSAFEYAQTTTNEIQATSLLHQQQQQSSIGGKKIYNFSNFLGALSTLCMCLVKQYFSL